ncbi:MAG: GNAT family N-acetyltransferase [Paracoccaceae bacterium]
MNYTIIRGLPANLRADAAAIYWQAFGGKLGTVMGPDAMALRYLGRVINPSHALCAIDDRGALLGLIGFKTPQGAFADGDFRDLRAVYGIAGALWRAAVLRMLQQEVDNERFLIDGICVTRTARGCGVGSALIDAICTEARALGYGAIRLDVIDTNWRAKQLYERLGFLTTRTDQIGPLRHIFGFSAATVMVKPLV